MSTLAWLITSKIGRMLLTALAGLIGWMSFAGYYKYQGRKQVYEQVRKDTQKAKETRDEVDRKTGTLPDDDVSRWLRKRGVGE